MAETTKEQPKKAEKKEVTPAEMLAAESKKKQPWTLERCQKAARRFTSEQEWQAGAPASHKSATAHGWVKQCVSVMMKPKKVQAPTRKSA
jgi:hypothetical protein